MAHPESVQKEAEALMANLPTNGEGWYIEDKRPGFEDEARVYDQRSYGVIKPIPNRPEYRRPIANFAVAAPRLIRALLTLVRGQEADQGWREISTAPKDGTRVWGCWNHRIYGWCFAVCRYTPAKDGCEGYWYAEGGGKPTHWRALDPPGVQPKADKESI